MAKKETHPNEIILLTLVLCVFYVLPLNAQLERVGGQFKDSLYTTKQYFNSAHQNLIKFSKQDSLLSFNRIKIRTSVTAESRYYGLAYENATLPKWTTTYKVSNKIDLGGLPFQLDGFFGNKIAVPGRGISPFK